MQYCSWRPVDAVVLLAPPKIGRLMQFCSRQPVDAVLLLAAGRCSLLLAAGGCSVLLALGMKTHRARNSRPCVARVSVALGARGSSSCNLVAVSFKQRQPMVSVGIRLNVSGGHWGLTFPPLMCCEIAHAFYPNEVHEAVQSQKNKECPTYTCGQTYTFSHCSSEGGGEGFERINLATT